MDAVLPAIETRAVMLDDLDVVLADVRAGFDSYVELAPTGWQPPAVPADRDRSAELLADPMTWGLLALAEQCPVGHIAFFPRERPGGTTSSR